MLWKLGNVFGRLSSFISRHRARPPARVVKTGGTVDRVNKQLDKADTITDSAVSMADSADTAVRAVSFAIAKPVEKVSGAAAGVSHALLLVPQEPRLRDAAMDDAKEAAAGAQPIFTRISPRADADAPSAPRSPPASQARPWQRPSVQPDPAPVPDELRSLTRSAPPASLRSRHADDGRAARGLPLVLRGEGPSALPVGVAVPRADDHSTLLDDGRDAAADAVLPRARAAACAAHTTVQKVLPHAATSTRSGSTATTSTFFEMLGNFSFGQYFKEGAIAFAPGFIREHMRARLGPASGPPCTPATRSWGSGRTRSRSSSGSRSACRASGSCRCRAPRTSGPVGGPGPCGPDSEIYYDWGEELGCGEPDCAPGCARCERFLEFWNLVFMEYELARGRHADAAAQAEHRHRAWASSARARIVQNVMSVYDTDGYQLIMDWIAARVGRGLRRLARGDEGAPRPRRPRRAG